MSLEEPFWIKYKTDTKALSDLDGTIYATKRTVKKRSGTVEYEVRGYSKQDGQHRDVERKYLLEDLADKAAHEIYLRVKPQNATSNPPKEYVIWGIPEGEIDEVVLLAKYLGKTITDKDLAKKLAHVLKNKYKPTHVRIQEVDMSGDLDWLKETGLSKNPPSSKALKIGIKRALDSGDYEAAEILEDDLKRLQAPARNPSGEWWIDDDGGANFADGDASDTNHEMLAFEGALSISLDSPEVGQPDMIPSDKLSKAAIEWLKEHGAPEDAIEWLKDGSDARDYMMVSKNWIRVQGDNFQMQTFDDDALDRIKSSDVWGDEEGLEESDATVSIEEISTNKVYTLPLRKLFADGAAAAGLKRYADKFSAGEFR